MRCSNCGKISPDGSKVCMMCGMPFMKLKHCPKCGNLIDADAVFCLQCGWKYEAKPDSVPQQEKFYSGSKKQEKNEKSGGTVWKAFSWVGVVFGLVAAVAYMISLSSFLFLLFALILMPVDAIQDFWENAKIKGALKGLFLIILFFASCISAPASSTLENDESKAPVKNIQTVSDNRDAENQKKESDKGVVPNPEEKESTIDLSLDTSGYMKIDANVLFEYGNYMGGQKVITVISADNVDTYSHMIKARTPNNDGYFFSIVCEFADQTVIESIKEGTIITVAGTLEERNPLVDTFSFLEAPTASLENCVIVGYGEIAQELKDGSAEQRKIGTQAKQAYEAQVAAANKEEKDTYISQCETVKYSDVERNPDNYKGKLVKFTGKVVQVSEGWFDSVTMRIDSGGNMWYVTYSREKGESRILEGDKITCYGECNGVTSYTTVLGSQVTIPSMSMEYYE